MDGVKGLDIGTIVRLKSGSPKMTVMDSYERKFPDGGVCIWLTACYIAYNTYVLQVIDLPQGCFLQDK